MNFSRGSHCLLAVTSLLVAGVAHAATVSRDILDDGATVALYNPSAAVDSDGNIHIVANGMDAASPGTASEDVYYMLVRPSGTVLIGASPLTTDGPTTHGRPRVAINAADQAVVVFGGGNRALTRILVDPSLDATQDGGPLAPAAIVVAPTVVGTDTNRGHLDMAVDSAGIAHAVMIRNSNIFYIAFNPVTGVNFNLETDIGNSSSNRATPAVAIDSEDNIHIVASACEAGGDCPPAYKMLDNEGVTVINWVKLYDASTLGPHGSHHSIAVDGNDHVHIVYGDKRNTIDNSSWCNSGCGLGGTVIYTELDPSLDLTPTTIADIRVGEEVEMTNQWYPRAFRDGGKMRVYASSKSGGNIIYTSVGLGGSSASTPRLIEANIQHVGWSQPYVASTGNRVIWSEGVFVPTPAGATHQLVMASASSFGGGGGGSGSPGLPLLLVLALAGATRLVRGRAA
jgi:hypothetical protein